MSIRLVALSLFVSVFVAAQAGCGDNIPSAAGDCGNAVLDDGEECDDGNNNDGDGCTAGCAIEPSCGDGTMSSGEECDDGNTDDGDGCSSTCTLEPDTCGNGMVEEGEACDDANNIAFDGCEADCTASPDEVSCFDHPPAQTGVCDVSGSGDAKLIQGDILTPSTILRGGEVAVDDTGSIVCVGCDCSSAVSAPTTITCPDAVVSPGLINPHDHLGFVNNVPYTDTGERYEHRHDWRRGRNGHTEINVNSGANRDQLLYGELRFAMGGATSVIGAGGTSGILRNLDRDDDDQGLGQPPVDLDTFPLGDSGGEQLSDGCNYPNIRSQADIADEEAYNPHVSEGIDAFSRNEFLCLSRTDLGGEDLLEPQSAFIHGAGLSPIDYTRMTDQGTMLIWSARSNVALYGDTASVTTADRLGVPIALGTDWIRTGSSSLLRELACADSLNTTYYGGHFSDKQLWEMVTLRAAEVAAMDDAIGVLLPDRIADIAIFDASSNVDYRAIIDANPSDVTLVLRGGEPLYGDSALVDALAASCDPIDVCTVAKRACTFADSGQTLAELQAANSDQYELFSCGVPTGEPSCVPSRPVSVNGSTTYDGSITATDGDGDGIEDASDNCPNVFNPIRPVDNGAQADFDRDGEGDACDECPMDAGVTDCIAFDEGDVDADGVANDDDNCPEVWNDDQADGDSDDRGDVCDACPADSNPAPIACPATIYEVKTGASESRVSMNDVLVTACLEGRGFFLQVHEGEAIYAGPENSGVFLFDNDTECGVTITSGDRINISPSADIQDFFGQTQLANATYAIQTNGNPLPAPFVLTPASAGGAVANDFEGILATVENVSVTEVNPPAGPGDNDPTNAFVVDGQLRVDDLVHLTANFPTVGAVYDSISGVLAFRNQFQKLHPLAEVDLVPGPPTLVGFAPATSFIREGDNQAPTIPTPLTVTLSSPPVADTLVAISSGDDTSLTVDGGGATVLAGQTSATVLVNGLSQSAGVTLTADFDGTQLTADVRVIGAAELNTVVDLQPDGGSASPGGTLDLTVTLDFPAPAGGEVVTLAITNNGTGSTVGPSVTVLENDLTATFTVTAGATTGDEVVSASLNGSSVNANFSVADGGLIINEVAYDQPAADDDEYIELFNGSSASIDLTDFALVLVNGSINDEYAQHDLSGTLGIGQYLVVGDTNAVNNADPGSVTIEIAGFAVQNGAPDGIGLFRISDGALIDAIAYENGGGGMTAVTTNNFGTVNLVEGTATAVTDAGNDDGAICRIPDATDTDDSNDDWAFCATATPGAANVE